MVLVIMPTTAQFKNLVMDKNLHRKTLLKTMIMVLLPPPILPRIFLTMMEVDMNRASILQEMFHYPKTIMAMSSMFIHR